MSSILAGQEGVLCHIDDIIVFGRNQEEHDIRLQSVLKTIKKAGVTLNKEKCEFNKDRLVFLGHVINEDGISPDPEKTAAVSKMKRPQAVSDLRRFLGMANQLGKFTPNLAELSQPLRELLSSKNAWAWGHSQEEAFKGIKRELTQPATLAVYNAKAPTKISADASAFGLGAVLLQQSTKEWKPVAYASRALTDTEKRYSQIEKEALAIVWACERFTGYVLGKQIVLETDHKPLVPLLSRKDLASLPPRILQFRLCLARFQYEIMHVPGKLLYTADALSRAPIYSVSVGGEEKRMEAFVAAVISSLPASDGRLEEYRKEQRADATCSQVIVYCQEGWPNNDQIKDNVKPYWSKCRQRIASAVWWPGVYNQLEAFVKACPSCLKTAINPKEPLMQTPLPDRPWQRIAADICELKGVRYLVVIDYYSRYIEVKKLSSTKSSEVIASFKAMFAHHGIPSILMCDNGPQLVSKEMKEFAASYGFKQITSSPYYAQSNGLAERAVRTVKALLNDAPDPFMALLSYRATPLPWCNLSPAELLMGRRICTDVPVTEEQLTPDWPYLEEFKMLDAKYKETQKANYDRRRRVRNLPLLPNDSPVWVSTRDHQAPGTIVRPADASRSYVVNVPSGQTRRNRGDLRQRLDTDEPEHTPPQGPATRLRTGASVQPPDRLTYYSLS